MRGFMVALIFLFLAATVGIVVSRLLQPHDVVIPAGTVCEFQKWRDVGSTWEQKNTLYADYVCGGTPVLMTDAAVLSDQLHGRGSRVECVMTKGRWLGIRHLMCTLVPRAATDDLG
jgi:hypothetical protein